MKLKPDCEMQSKSRLVSNFFNSPQEGIVELYGTSGVGKTTLAIQYAVDFLQIHKGKKVLYISIDQPFCVKRLYDILACRDLMEAEINNIASRLFVVNLRTLEDQSHFIRYFLSHAIEKLKIGVVIFDSICGNIRPEYRDLFLTADLYHCAHIFRKCFLFNQCRFLCINQVADDINCMDNQSKPCLGNSWTNSISTRICLQKKIEPHLFFAKIVFSAHRAPNSWIYTIEGSGIVVQENIQ